MDAVAESEVVVDGPWELPEGWRWAPLGKLGAWTGGGTPSKANAAFWTEGNIPWVSPKDMKVEVIGDTEDKITAAAVDGSSAKYVAKGSVLMVMRSGILKHSFPVAVTDRIVTLNQDLRALTPHDGICPRFVARYLNLAANRVLHDCSKDGTTVDSIEVAALDRLLVPIAPLAEQRRIVARIDALFAEIAEGEAALAEARKGLDMFRRVLLKAALTGELTKDWRVANPDIESGHDFLLRAQGDGTKKLPTKSRRHGVRASALKAAPPVLPEGWTSAALGDLLSHLTSGSRDWAEYYDRGSKIFVMAQNVRPGRYNHSYTKHVDPPLHLKDVERSRVQRDDLLVTIVGANTGDVCRIDFDAKDYFVCQSVALMRPISPELSAYLEMYLVAPDGGRGQMDKVIYGAGRPHLSFDQIESLVIPIPPRAEIDEILRVVSDGISAAYDTYAMLDAEAADATRLKQSVLKATFEGRLSSQDPADEPASALLARLVQAASEAKPRRTKKIAQ